MRINHNISAMNTYRQYNVNTANANGSMEKLSSGYRINRAADDAAGLSISEKMRSQIRGLTQATRNAEDGVSFIQTAEGALNEVSDMLVRLKELAVQVKNGTYSADDKNNIGAEMKALGTAIGDVLTNTKFNGIAVFTTGAAIKYGEDGTQTVTIAAATTTNFTLLKAETDTANTAPADVTTDLVENTITEMNTNRATYGAQQNQLDHAANNLSTTKENLQSAESRVRDVDMAEEMMEYTKNNILLQAAQSMLAQANSQPQGVLQLLR
ncbi:Flagellin [bioreactor metagenome]|uniref:Flagellin n=1 Tax=bioreactor metagenome TaxID=1076179 RepID=A0A645AMM3_9ZZZZ|nr:flagellin [Oscillospiraceae bacterium]